MQRIDFSFIALKKIVVSPKGARQKQHKIGWERCIVVLQGDHIRIWKAGGILINYQEVLDEIKSESQPIHEFNLRLIDIQKISDHNCFCFHFTQGMERLLIAPENSIERGLLEIWDEMFGRAIRQSIYLDQCSTSRYLKSLPESCFASIANTSEYDLFKESFVVDCKWPGFEEYQILKLSVKMRPGWNDRRVVSKRCIALTRDVSGKPVDYASISPLNTFHVLSEPDQIIVLEGQGRYNLNDPQVAPFAERITIKPAHAEDMPRLLVFLRDTFEVIFPNSNFSKQSPISTIAMRPIDSINTVPEVREFDFNVLVEPKPWAQTNWSHLFNAFQQRAIKNQKLNPKQFTKKLKSLGFCLKTREGTVVTSESLNRMSEFSDSEFEANVSSMVWHHLNIVEGQ